MQKRARRRHDVDVVLQAADIEPIERLHRRLCLAFGVAERREVVRADQTLCGGVHGAAVEQLGDAQGPAPLEGQIGAAIDDAIKIMPLGGGEAGIEIVRHLLGRDDRDRLRPQMRVHGIAHGVGLPVLVEIDVGDLAERMHARIGAARSLHVDHLAAELRHRLLERGLHGRSVVLDLPADERPAVIFDGELVAGHGDT